MSSGWSVLDVQGSEVIGCCEWAVGAVWTHTRHEEKTHILFVYLLVCLCLCFISELSFTRPSLSVSVSLLHLLTSLNQCVIELHTRVLSWPYVFILHQTSFPPHSSSSSAFSFSVPFSSYSGFSLPVDTTHPLFSLVFSDLLVLCQSVYTHSHTHGYQI